MKLILTIDDDYDGVPIGSLTLEQPDTWSVTEEQAREIAEIIGVELVVREET